VPAIVILGADTVLAARPATAVQLANACLAAGYSAAVPASWGDELIAAACLEAIATRGDEATVMCVCPRVVERLRRVPSLKNSLLSFVPPPVAAARYLRARAGAAGLTITYVGDCPGAADPAIDRYATPAALMRSLARRGIVPAALPTEIDPRVERDGRRFYSLAGGVPAPNWVYADGRGPGVVQPESSDYVAEIAHHVSARDRAVIDIAPRLGCACSGAVPGEPWAAARQAVTNAEPERAVHEVLDHDVLVDVSSAPEAWVGSAVGGVPTLPTTLAVLAGLHDPDSKAPAIRRAPPSPVPYPMPTRPARRAGKEPAFPAGPLPRPRAPESFTAGPPPNARPLSGPERVVEPISITEPYPVPEPRRVDPVTAATFAALRPNQTSPGPITAANLVPIPAPSPTDGPGSPNWDGVDRRRWDGVERRQGWVNNRPPGSEAPTKPVAVEPRTGPIRPRQPTRDAAADRRLILGLAVACSAIVASATSMVTIHLLSRDRAAASVAATAASPSPSTLTPPTSDSAPAPDADNAPAAAPVADTVIAPPVAATPRVAPAQPRPRRVRRAPPVPKPAPTPLEPPARATVIAPGAVPIPQPSPPPLESPELLQIRAEIAARKRRVDSLGQIVDSLRLLPMRPLTAASPQAQKH
jgi:hypothetical protein